MTMCNLSQRHGILLLASNLVCLKLSSENFIFYGQIHFSTLCDRTYLQLLHTKTIDISQSKICPYKVKKEKLKEEKYRMNSSSM